MRVMIAKGTGRQKSGTGMESLSQALADLEHYIGEAS